MPSIDIRADALGPIVDGSAHRVTADMVNEIQRIVASKAFSEVHMLLDQSIRNPTPYYETQIIQERQADDIVIHDRGIIYGPWLEGVSRRNRATRFKGYAAFRRARKRVEAKIPDIAVQVLDRYLPQLGGSR